MCDHGTEKAASPIEGLFRDSNSVWRQRPYAYAFCLTSVHQLCTALINTVRLRKLHSFQEADVVVLVPKSWGPIIQSTMRSNRMHDLQQWAVQTAEDSVTETTPESVRKLREQQKQLPIFQGVALADYDLVGMLAKMIALGVVFRPSDIFEHMPGTINTTHYQREATSKLHLFGLIEYKQVLFLDADGLILQNLDAVFNLNVTPLALLPKEVTEAEGEEYSTRLMLLQPSQAVQAQLQFVVEKDLDFNDARILSGLFSGRMHSI
ncbi:N-acetylglucosaminyltransferase [Trebouxia sp. C0010 RCD-2024]